ncbi:ribonuclease P protein component [Austwickia chelonae]|uniref:ribonuclease P protein component n=1 Tax=Austwickia chelonae TaxID=100225 RepID=UPI000E223146|nr:ribonuclease P protein component [Austwickia chelonae]
MLPARHRLRDKADFAAAVRSRRSGGPRLVVHATKTDARAGAPPRVGLVVSKAVGNAVVRNRTKRRVRALMKTHIAELPAGIDLVIRARPTAANASYEQLARDLDRQISSVLTR